MKRLLGMACVTILLAGCASDYTERGGAYYEGETSGAAYGTSDYPTPSQMQTNGPGMHSETRTGLPGPGTTGVPSQWDGGTMP